MRSHVKDKLIFTQNKKIHNQNSKGQVNNSYCITMKIYFFLKLVSKNRQWSVK